jgi:uncharacterized protein
MRREPRPAESTVTPANENRPKNAAGPCAICGKPTHEAHRPFCSKRCADVDLQRWLSGRYAIPVVEDEDVSEDESGEGSRDP